MFEYNGRINNALWRMVLVTVIIPVLAGWWFSAHAQKASDPKYQPTEIQALKLDNKKKDMIIAYQQAQVAQAAYTRALQEYSGYAEEIKKENGWDKGVRFDLNSGQFLEPPKEDKPAAKPEAKKP